MVNTIEEAQKRGMKIRKEVRFYAVREDGVLYHLKHDWTHEEFDNETIIKGLEWLETRMESMQDKINKTLGELKELRSKIQ